MMSKQTPRPLEGILWNIPEYYSLGIYTLLVWQFAAIWDFFLFFFFCSIRLLFLLVHHQMRDITIRQHYNTPKNIRLISFHTFILSHLLMHLLQCETIINYCWEDYNLSQLMEIKDSFLRQTALNKSVNWLIY